MAAEISVRKSLTFAAWLLDLRAWVIDALAEHDFPAAALAVILVAHLGPRRVAALRTVSDYVNPITSAITGCRFSGDFAKSHFRRELGFL